jgi:hypothetical protein
VPGGAVERGKVTDVPSWNTVMMMIIIIYNNNLLVLFKISFLLEAKIIAYFICYFTTAIFVC